MSETLTERLVSALAEARELIRAYHGLPGWAEYQHSPEMKRINGALDAWARAPVSEAAPSVRDSSGVAAETP